MESFPFFSLVPQLLEVGESLGGRESTGMCIRARSALIRVCVVQQNGEIVQVNTLIKQKWFTLVQLSQHPIREVPI